MLEAKGLSLACRIKNVDCLVPPGQLTLILGRSGSGKSTLLRCLAGLEKKIEGSITLHGQSISSIKPKERACMIGYIPQSFLLFPHLKVQEAIAQPLRLTLGLPRQEAMERALALLQMFGIEELCNRLPSQISGGQRQRVSILRALGLNPSYLLLDEPSSALDPDNTRILADILLQLQAQGTSVVLSTQDMSLAEMVQGTVYKMEKGCMQ